MAVVGGTTRMPFIFMGITLWLLSGTDVGAETSVQNRQPTTADAARSRSDIGVGAGLHTPAPRGRTPAPPDPAVTLFGTPSPPSHLTPAPVLPFTPNRLLMPQPPTPPQTPMVDSPQGGR
jgi:hypothetical protein